MSHLVLFLLLLMLASLPSEAFAQGSATVAGVRGVRPSKYTLPEFPYNISVGS